MNKNTAQSGVVGSQPADYRPHMDRPCPRSRQDAPLRGNSIHSPATSMAYIPGPGTGGMDKERFQSREVLLELLQPPSSSLPYQDGGKMSFGPDGRGSQCSHCMGCRNNRTTNNAEVCSLRKKANGEWIETWKGNGFVSESVKDEPITPFIPSTQSHAASVDTQVQCREAFGKVRFGACDENVYLKTGRTSSMPETVRYPCCLAETHPYPSNEFKFHGINCKRSSGEFHEYSNANHRLSQDTPAARSTTEGKRREERERESGETSRKEPSDYEHSTGVHVPPTRCHGCRSQMCQRGGNPSQTTPSEHHHPMNHTGGIDSADNLQMEHTLQTAKPQEFAEGFFLHRRDQQHSRHPHTFVQNNLRGQSVDSSAYISMCSSEKYHRGWNSFAHRSGTGPSQDNIFEERKQTPGSPRHGRENQALPAPFLREHVPSTKLNPKMAPASSEECTPVIVQCYSLSTSAMGSTNGVLVPAHCQGSPRSHEEDFESTLPYAKRAPDPCVAEGHSHRFYQHRLSKSANCTSHLRYNDEVFCDSHHPKTDPPHSLRLTTQLKSAAKEVSDPERNDDNEGHRNCIPRAYSYSSRVYSMPDPCLCENCAKPQRQQYVRSNAYHGSTIQVAKQGRNHHGESWPDWISRSPSRNEGQEDVNHMQSRYIAKRYPGDVNDVQERRNADQVPKAAERASTFKIHDYYEERRIFVEKKYQDVGNPAGNAEPGLHIPSSYAQEKLLLHGNHTSRHSTSPDLFQRETCEDSSLDQCVHQHENTVGSKKRKSRQPRPQRGKADVLAPMNDPHLQNTQGDVSKETVNNHANSPAIYDATASNPTHFPVYENEKRIIAPENSHAASFSAHGHPSSINRRNSFFEHEPSRLGFHSSGGHCSSSPLLKRANVPFEEREPIVEFPRSALEIPSYGAAGENRHPVNEIKHQNKVNSPIQSKDLYHSWYQSHVDDPFASFERHQRFTKHLNDSSPGPKAKQQHWDDMLLKNGFSKRLETLENGLAKRNPANDSSHVQYPSRTIMGYSNTAERGTLFEDDLTSRFARASEPTWKVQVDVNQERCHGIDAEFRVSQSKGPLSGSDVNGKTTLIRDVKTNNCLPDHEDVSSSTPENRTDILDKDGDNSSSPSAHSSPAGESESNLTKEPNSLPFTNFKMSSHAQEETGNNLTSIVKERRFLCRFCSKKFAHFSTLQNHLRTHTGDKPFQCKFCSRRFAQSGVLKAHLRTHTGDKPFSCLFCGKMFAQSTTLTNHLRTHTGQKPYTCQFCAKSFSQPSTLRKHELSHTKERPYPCKFCGKAFAQQSTLTNHLRSHTGQRPYKCHFCDKCFAQLSTLDRHLHLHTSVSHKPHQCQYCGKSFSYLSNLASHIKHHEQGQL